MAGKTVTVNVENEQALDVVYWFRQNKQNIENMIGAKVSTMTLTYDKTAGYVMTYEKDEVVQPEA